MLTLLNRIGGIWLVRLKIYHRATAWRSKSLICHAETISGMQKSRASEPPAGLPKPHAFGELTNQVVLERG
jgi:hypothetical protein